MVLYDPLKSLSAVPDTEFQRGAGPPTVGSGRGCPGQLSNCHCISFSEKGHKRGFDRVMLLIFRLLTSSPGFSGAGGQPVSRKAAWLPWWMVSWQQTRVRCLFLISQPCQWLLLELVMWLFLAHLCILRGTAKSHSTCPPLSFSLSLSGETLPMSTVYCSQSVVRAWLVLPSLQPSLLKVLVIDSAGVICGPW